MGFLEDLIKTVQEAAEEARAQQRQNKSAPEWTPVPPAAAAPVDKQAARIVRRYREQVENAGPRQPTPTPSATPSTIPPRPRQQIAGADRLGRLLRQHATLRELMLLREILDQPLSLRRSRGRHRRPH